MSILFCSSLIAYYEPVITSASEYYPFGMMMRQASAKNYRFGFNGQERSDEIKGLGNSYTAQFWEYDSRIGRRWNLDPRPMVGVSEYSAFANNPIRLSDPLGDTTVVGAGGTQNIEIDEKKNSLEFYGSQGYNVTGSTTKAPVQSGQLRSFTNALGRFSARWKGNGDGTASFIGYRNDQDQTIDEAVLSFRRRAALANANIFRDIFSLSQSMYRKSQEDPVGFVNSLMITHLALNAPGIGGMTGGRGYNPSVTLSESAGVELGIAYRAINPKFAQSTTENGFYMSGAAGRLGNDGIYANSTVQGAVKEFQYHNPGIVPAVFEVRYPLSRPLLINPPAGYFSQPLPFTQGFNILSAPSLRAPGTTNLLIRTGAEVGKKIQ